MIKLSNLENGLSMCPPSSKYDHKWSYQAMAHLCTLRLLYKLYIHTYYEAKGTNED